MRKTNTHSEVIVYFDDKCILCNRSVELILKWEKNQTLKFSSIDNNPNLPERIGKNMKVDTIVLKEGDKFFTQSTAVLRISGYLKNPFPLLKVFFIIPAFIRDFAYDYVARNRHKWFGRTDYCKLMTNELKNRLIL